MSTFLFKGFSYARPVFSILAYRREELPEAFSQMEKLRGSGWLAGYVRRAALDPAAPCPAGTDEAKPRPILKFSLYRARAPFTPPQPGPRLFCPALLSGTEREPVKLRTACGGRLLFDMLSPDFAGQGFFQDSFEEILAFSDAPTPRERPEGTKPSAEELLRRAVSAGCGLVMAVFSAREDHILADGRVLDRPRQEKGYDLWLGACPDRAAAFRALCLPRGLRLAVQTRLERGAAFLLDANLARLARLGREHAVDASEAEELAGDPVRAHFPAPGLSLFSGADLPWREMPAPLAERLASGGWRKESGEPQVLRLLLAGDGHIEVSAGPLAPLPDSVSVARRVLDERSDLPGLDLTARLPCEETMTARLEDGSLADALAVNRFGVVAGCLSSDLVFRQAGALCTTPDEAGGRRGVLREALLARGLLREKSVTLAQVLSCQELFCLDSLRGLRPVRFTV